jgi:hypothetical protein
VSKTDKILEKFPWRQRIFILVAKLHVANNKHRQIHVAQLQLKTNNFKLRQRYRAHGDFHLILKMLRN